MRYRWLLTFTLVLLLAAGLAGQPVVAQDGTAATFPIGTVINANALNVRGEPNTFATVIAVLPRGSSYSVLGRTADNTWWQIALVPSGLTGWVSGQFFSVTNAQLVPVVNFTVPAPAPPPNGVVNTAQLNVRAIPDPFSGAVLTRVAFSETYLIVGRNDGPTRWYQISLPTGITGWVNARYLNVTNVQNVPVTYTTGPTIPQPQVFGTVTAFFLNVRTTPNPYIANIITVIARGQTFQVIGRNAAGTWWQINLGNGITGWVSGRYFAVSNGGGLPVTG